MTRFKILTFLIFLPLYMAGCGDAEHLLASTNASFSAGASCEETFINRYRAQIHPFFRAENHCVKCHVEGGIGLGLFASPDAKISFASFNAAGVSKIRYMATNPQHKPPYTGSQNAAEVDAWTAKWNQGQAEYLACSAAGGTNDSLLTSPKNAASIYATRDKIQTLSWDLETAADLDETTKGAVPAVLKIDVKVFYQNNLAKGYVFSNPVIQLKDGSKQVLAESLYIHINGQRISSQTTFANISRVISGSSAIPLMPGALANTYIEPISSNDTFQLYFSRLALTSGGGDDAPPLTPILKAFDSETGSSLLIKSRDFQISVLRDAGILRWCLSESSTPPANADAPCASGLSGNGTLNGWTTSRPDQYSIGAGDGTRTLYLWVANQNLKLNTTPARVDFTLDTVGPAAPVINSITVTDTQVAAMSVSHPNESDVTGWCVIEQNAILNAPNKPDLKNNCWNWTDLSVKPTTVGFKEGGTRRVWVYVRDKAGNVSAASNVVQASNPFGAITYTQLTNPAGGPRAIFQNRCYTCHGTNANPGYSQLKLFNYQDALEVAEEGTLVSRINNVISPMPNVNGGLMPQRERDLIRLWVTPEEGNTPLQ